MNKKTITHEIKLQKSVIIILGIIALGLCANVFAPALSIEDAIADLDSGDRLRVQISGSFGCDYGCN
mgnify:CR=1 FL=1